MRAAIFWKRSCARTRGSSSHPFPGLRAAKSPGPIDTTVDVLRSTWRQLCLWVPDCADAHPGMGGVCARARAVGITANVEKVESRARLGVSSKNSSCGVCRSAPLRGAFYDRRKLEAFKSAPGGHAFEQTALKLALQTRIGAAPSASTDRRNAGGPITRLSALSPFPVDVR